MFQNIIKDDRQVHGGISNEIVMVSCYTYVHLNVICFCYIMCAV